MPMNLTTDMLLAQPASGGTTLKKWWPADVVMKALVDTGLVNGVYQTTAPGDTTKLWIDTSAGVASSAGAVKVYNGSAWVLASTNPTLWAERIVALGGGGGGGGGLTSVTTDGTYLNGDGTGGSPLDIDEVALKTLFDGYYSPLGHTHSDATTGAAGFMSAADKTKLDGISAGATVGVTAATLYGTGVGALLISPPTTTALTTARGTTVTCTTANTLPIGGSIISVQGAVVSGQYVCLSGTSHLSNVAMLFIRTA